MSLLFSALLFLTLPLAFGSAVEVSFHDSAVTRGPRILFSDIASFKGGEEGLRRSLGEMVVGLAAPAGRFRKLSVDRLDGLFLKPYSGKGAAMIVKRPREIIVKTTSADIPGVVLEARLRTQILSRMPWKKEQVLLTLDNLPAKVEIPPGDYTIELETARNCDYKGGEPMEAVILQSEKAVRRVPFTASLRVYAKVAVAQRKIRRGSTVATVDLQLDEREITALREESFFSIEAAAGRKALRTIAEGRILDAHMVEIPPLIARGDRIRILHRERTAQVSVDGLARQNGGRGDRILVQNAMTRQLQQGVIMEAGVVQLLH